MRILSRIENFLITFFYMLGITGLSLIRTNSFHPAPQIILSFLITITLLWFWNRISENSPQELQHKDKKWWIVCLAAISGIAVFNALFPASYMLGDRDPGLYFLFSAVISETGSLNLHLPEASQAAAEIGDLAAPGYPGIYDAVKHGFSETPGDHMPQFAHLFCAYGALLHRLFGIEGLIRTNAIIGLFALLSFAKVLRKLFPGWLVAAGIIMLGLNPAFLWNSRQTLTETLSIFILFSGISLMLRTDRKHPGIVLFVAGAVIASGILNRVDALLNSVIVAGFIVAASTKWEKKIVLALPAAFLTIGMISILEGFFFAGPYYQHLWKSGTLPMLLALCIMVIPASVIIFFASTRKITIPRTWINNGITAGAILLGLWICWRFFPGETHPSESAKRAVKELSWYILPLSYPLIIVGLHFAARDKNASAWIPITLICGLALFVFTWKPYAWPDHFWASRRWLTHVIPFGTIITLYTFSKLHASPSPGKKNLGNAIIVLVIVLMLGNSFYVSRTFATQKLLEDYPADLKQIDKVLDETEYGDYLVSNSHQLASYLTYMYKHPTILLSPKGRVSLSGNKDCAQLDGRYFIGIPFLSQAHTLEAKKHFLVKGSFPEHAVARIPEKLSNRVCYYEMGLIKAGNDGSQQHHILAMDSRLLTTPAGIKDYSTEHIVSTGKAGFLQYGPYMVLDKGSYTVIWTGKMQKPDSEEIGYADVTLDSGKTVAAKVPVSWVNRVHRGTLAEAKFILDKPTKGAEFRFYVNDGISVQLEKITLIRTAP